MVRVIIELPTVRVSKEKPKFVVHLGGMSLDHVVNEGNTGLMMERAVDNFKKLLQVLFTFL